MSITIEPILARHVRPLVDSRPPLVTWARTATAGPAADQPPLDLLGVEVETVRGSARPARRQLVKARWTVCPRADLPDAVEWSATLAVAIMQALLLQRPATQLNRWLEEDVLTAIGIHQRRRRAAGPRPTLPVTVQSIRVQHPAADVAEVAAQLTVGRRPTTMAFRLDALGDRWLCTALELGPRAQPD